jgi:hypothetical protein
MAVAETTITIRSYGVDREECQELGEQLRAHATVTMPPPSGAPRYDAVIVITAVLTGTAGVLSAAYPFIKAFLDRHRDSEVSFDRGDRHVDIKGYDARDAKSLIRELFPEDPE